MNQQRTGTRAAEDPGPPPSAVLEAEELAALRESVRGVCSRYWPSATESAEGDLAALWAVAARQEWMSLADPDLFSAAVAVQEELGRVACPLPVVDAALAGAVLQALGDHRRVAAIADGTVRPVIARSTRRGPASERIHDVEAAAAATHLLVVDDRRGTAAWYALDGAGRHASPGLPVPSWWQVDLQTGPEWVVPLADHPDLVPLRRIGLAARAMAAVRRTHELAVEHAKVRRQFGVPIGTFQAVSHRLVDVEIAVTSAQSLLEHALELRATGSASWRTAAEIYLEFVAERLADLQFAGHHTLAAVGYFEEHQAPWLTRRVQADLATLAAEGSTEGVGALLLDQGARLPDFDLGPAAERIRGEVVAAFAPWSGAPPAGLHTWDDSARAVLRDRDWLGVGWPRELGGGGFSTAELVAFTEAIAYSSPPVGNIWMAINSIVPMLIAVGPPALRDLVMAEVRRGDLSIALGYSEPDAGSDLASLRTRADRVEGGWRISGQKLWGTCVPDSRMILLAARTDPAASRPHAGISLFLVDLDSPGITVQQHRSFGGEISATTFWDDVFVPEDRLLGRENEGWAALGAALAGERILIGTDVMKAHRTFDLLLEAVRADPERVVAARRQDLRSRVGGLAVRLQAARSLIHRAVVRAADEEGPAAASMAKVAAAETCEEVAAAVFAILGPGALYGPGQTGDSGAGWFEHAFRNSIMSVIAGGTADIQRNLIARGMGLPR